MTAAPCTNCATNLMSETDCLANSKQWFFHFQETSSCCLPSNFGKLWIEIKYYWNSLILFSGSLTEKEMSKLTPSVLRWKFQAKSHWIIMEFFFIMLLLKVMLGKRQSCPFQGWLPNKAKYHTPSILPVSWEYQLLKKQNTAE